MYRALKVVLAVGLPVAALAIGQAASASVPPTEPPGSDLGAPVPADFVSLTDDTGTITVDVPSSWTDVATEVFSDGTSRTSTSTQKCKAKKTKKK